MESLKKIIAKNLVTYRKQAHLTQAELAQKLNYSDKNVSKWERAEGVPDVLVLQELADMYGVTVNDFLYEHVDEPKKEQIEEDKQEPVVDAEEKRPRSNKWLIALLSVGVAVFAAATAVLAWLLLG